MINHIEQIIAASQDLVTERLHNPLYELELAYFDSLCDVKKISEEILTPFSRNEMPFEQILQSNASFVVCNTEAEWSSLLLRGMVLLSINQQCYHYNASRFIREEAPKTQVESAIQGPQIALSEELKDSLNLVRNRYPSPELAVEERTIGTLSKTRTMLLYDQHRVDQKVLDHVKAQLTTINVPMIHSAGEIEKQLTGNKHKLFPAAIITERADRISDSLAKGKIVLLIQGSMFALILPVTFYDFMHAMDDENESYWMTRTLVLMRYMSVLLTITLPGLYISIVSYNPELFRVQLAFSIAGSRSAVPYPSFIEVLIMLFMIETLIEASVRLPRYIGSTATTVGGLILGQAAQQAGLVSSIMIIVTSVVAIANFVVPQNSMSFAIRFLKYPLILLSIFFGITGVTVGIFIYFVYLSGMRSFGVPYFRVPALFTKTKAGDIGQVRNI